MKYIMLFLFSVFISAIAQTILKNSSNDKHSNILGDYFNIKVFGAYFIFLLSTLITIYAYRYVPLSMGTILEASGYIFVSILGFLFLNEKVGKRKILGLFFIFIGIIIFAV